MMDVDVGCGHDVSMMKDNGNDENDNDNDEQITIAMNNNDNDEQPCGAAAPAREDAAPSG